MRIYGHRGIPVLATENTLDSFKKILEYSIDGVELDVHITKDGKLVVIHDYNMKKVFNHDLVIADHNYSEIEKINTSDGARVPLLSEVFSLLGCSIYYDIEVKSRGENRDVLCKALAKLINEYQMEENTIVSSFDPLLLRKFNQLNTGVSTALIYSRHREVPLLLREGWGMVFTKVDIIKPHYTQLKGFFYFLYTKVLKKVCYTWTINSKEDVEYARRRGCLGICSDYPHTFK